MAKPAVFVFGASGNVGFATVQALAAQYADKVEIRAGVRNPEKADKLKALANVTVVKATQGDKEELVKTLAEVHAVYIIAPGTEDRAEIAIRTAEAAKEAGVKHLLVLSVPIAVLTDTIFGKQFSLLESTVSKLGIPYTFLRLPMFMENYFGFKPTIQGMSKIITPIDPTKSYTPVAVGDAGRAAAAILVDPSKHTSKTYSIVSDRHSYSDVAKQFSEALGKEITILGNTYDEAKKFMVEAGMPEWQADGAMELMKLIDVSSPVADHANQSDYKSITGEEPTSLKDWVNAVAPAFK